MAIIIPWLSLVFTVESFEGTATRTSPAMDGQGPLQCRTVQQRQFKHRGNRIGGKQKRCGYELNNLYILDVLTDTKGASELYRRRRIAVSRSSFDCAVGALFFWDYVATR